MEIKSERTEFDWRGGDRVWWLHKPQGGIGARVGYVLRVPAIVEAVTHSRVTVRIFKQLGEREFIERKEVRPNNVMRRDTPAQIDQVPATKKQKTARKRQPAR